MLEYAINHLKVKDIVICGHSDCGACKALDANLEHDHSIPFWLSNAMPAKERVDSGTSARDDDKKARIEEIVKENVRLQIGAPQALPIVRDGRCRRPASGCTPLLRHRLGRAHAPVDQAARAFSISLLIGSTEILPIGRHFPLISTSGIGGRLAVDDRLHVLGHAAVEERQLRLDPVAVVGAEALLERVECGFERTVRRRSSRDRRFCSRRRGTARTRSQENPTTSTVTLSAIPMTPPGGIRGLRRIRGTG